MGGGGRAGLGYPCPVCQRLFGKRHHLKDHMYTHTGERPFPCPVCGLGFSQKSNMRRHARSTHPEVKLLLERFPQSACI
ncbi:Protein krueppel [Portunus trituberculatus]|uniref:Protein krueppel n=2 Tax=Portuninae TaxID=600346 RepID=A0A5B7EI93_PORTR|nr:Protein krueppel [Portunus trituberculatus]